MTVKPHPKPKPDNTYLRLDPELREQLDAIRSKEDRTLSSMIRVLLMEAIEAREKAGDFDRRYQESQQNRANNAREIA